MSEETCNCESGPCGCGCDGENDAFQRRYQTKAEQAEQLEAYLADLKLEVQAVEQKLADLKK